MSRSSRPESIGTVDDVSSRLGRDLTAVLGVPTTARVEQVTDRGTEIRIRFGVLPNADSVVERLRAADPEFYRDVHLESQGQFDVRCTIIG